MHRLLNTILGSMDPHLRNMKRWICFQLLVLLDSTSFVDSVIHVRRMCRNQPAEVHKIDNFRDFPFV